MMVIQFQSYQLEKGYAKTLENSSWKPWNGYFILNDNEEDYDFKANVTERLAVSINHGSLCVLQ